MGLLVLLYRDEFAYLLFLEYAYNPHIDVLVHDEDYEGLRIIPFQIPRLWVIRRDMVCQRGAIIFFWDISLVTV